MNGRRESDVGEETANSTWSRNADNFRYCYPCTFLALEAGYPKSTGRSLSIIHFSNKSGLWTSSRTLHRQHFPLGAVQVRCPSLFLQVPHAACPLPPALQLASRPSSSFYSGTEPPHPRYLSRLGYISISSCLACTPTPVQLTFSPFPLALCIPSSQHFFNRHIFASLHTVDDLSEYSNLGLCFS